MACSDRLVDDDTSPAPFSGVISDNRALGGVLSLTKISTAAGVATSGVNTGTLTLSGNNSYSGNTTVLGGTLSIAADAADNPITVNTIAPLGQSLNLILGGTNNSSFGALQATSSFTLNLNRKIQVGTGNSTGGYVLAGGMADVAATWLLTFVT